MLDHLQDKWDGVDVEQLVQQLGSENRRDINAALKTLRRLSNDQVVDVCLEIAGSIRESIRHAALTSNRLGLLQHDRASQAARDIARDHLTKSYVVELLAQFESAEGTKLQLAERKLDALQLGSVYKRVHQLLVSTNSEHLIAASLRIIGGSENPRAGKLIIPYLRHEAAQVRVAALIAIFSLRHKEMNSRVSELLLDPASEVRLTAFNVLTTFKAKPTTPRHRIAFHIASSSPKELVAKLWPETLCMNYENLDRTRHIQSEVQSLNESVGELSDLLDMTAQHTDPLVRAALAVILGTISTPRQHNLLTTLLHDEVAIVKSMAVLAIIRVFRIQQGLDENLLRSVQKHGGLCISVLSNWYDSSFGLAQTPEIGSGAESGLKILVLEALGWIGTSQAADVVTSKLKALATEAKELHKMGFNKSNEVKARLDSNSELQQYCWIALARIGSEQSLGELLFLRDFERLTRLSDYDRKRSREFSQGRLRNPFGGAADGCSEELTLSDLMIPSRAIPTLVSYLTSLEPRFRFLAAMLLKEWSWKPNSLLEHACWWASQQHPEGIKRLKNYGPDGVNVLRSLLSGFDPQFYSVAAQTLVECGAEALRDDERIARALVQQDFDTLNHFRERALSAVFRYSQYVLHHHDNAVDVEDQFEKMKPALVRYLCQLDPILASQGTIEFLLQIDPRQSVAAQLGNASSLLTETLPYRLGSFG